MNWIGIGETKREAREHLRGNVLFLFIAFVIIFGISFAAQLLLNFGLREIFPLPLLTTAEEKPQFLLKLLPLSLLPISILLGSVVSALQTTLMVGAMLMILRLLRGEFTSYGDLFSRFNHFFTYLWAIILMSIYITIWLLLFIIPGIIAALSYALTFWILADNPQMGANAAITRSKEMMRGHRFEFFLLGLSFIGWAVLSALTLGLAGVYVIPYFNMTLGVYYQRLKADYAKRTDGATIAVPQ